MSEQEQPKSFMQELDQWLDNNVVTPLVQAVYDDLKSEDPARWAKLTGGVKQAIRQKVLDSYHNGQKAGPRKETRYAPKKA
jgi:hypothetical protein